MRNEGSVLARSRSPRGADAPVYSAKTRSNNSAVVLRLSATREDCNFFQEMLKGCDFTVLGIGSVSKALAFLRIVRVAVLICDHELPVGTWRDLVEALTSVLDMPPQVIVARSSPSADFAADVRWAGGYGVLEKPFLPEQIRSTVAGAYDEWLRRADLAERKRHAMDPAVA